MLVISVHGSTKTIREEDHYQGMDDWRAIRTTLGDRNNPRNEQISRSNEQKNHKG